MRRTLLLVRHGETSWTAKRRMTSSTDVSLSARGLHQAETLAAAVKYLPPFELLTSPLERARQTAEVIGDMSGCEPVVVDCLGEQQFGPFEGFRDDASDTDFRRWRALGSDHRVPGVEPVREVFARAKAVLSADWTGLRVAVTHGNLSRILIAGGVLGQGPQEFRRLRLDPCHLAIASEDTEGWRLTGMNVSSAGLEDRVHSRLPL